MSKIGNHRVEMQETEDYAFGWLSAERGEPRPNWQAPDAESLTKVQRQQLGWDDYQNADGEH